MSADRDADQRVRPWQRTIHDLLRERAVEHVGHVPDGGHSGLIHLCDTDPEMTTTVLTTEEEGIGLAAGLWLGGQRAVLLMQSSGVGNCINLLSLPEACRIPLVMLVTVRGEWAEFVPWQVPMGSRTGRVLEVMGLDVYRVDHPEDVADEVAGALDQAFASRRSVAVLLGQRLIGRKHWGAAAA